MIRRYLIVICASLLTTLAVEASTPVWSAPPTVLRHSRNGDRRFAIKYEFSDVKLTARQFAGRSVVPATGALQQLNEVGEWQDIWKREFHLADPDPVRVSIADESDRVLFVYDVPRPGSVVMYGERGTPEWGLEMASLVEEEHYQAMMSDDSESYWGRVRFDESGWVIDFDIRFPEDNGPYPLTLWRVSIDAVDGEEIVR